MKKVTLLLFLLLQEPPPALADETVEQVVAVVNEDLLFLSDLRRDNLFFGDGVDASLQDQIGHRINHQLLLNEAKRFVLESPSEKEIGQSIKVIQHRFQNEGEFQDRMEAMGMTLEELKGEVVDRLLIATFLQDRIGFFIFVTDEEVDQYDQTDRNDFKGMSPKDRNESIQATLKAKKEKAKIDDYIAQLQSRAKIQINVR